MTDKQPTDPRAPIIGRLAKKFGLPPEVFTGTGDGKPPAIEVDLDPAGGRHQLVWRGGSGHTIAGMVTVHADGRVVNEGVPRQQWRPSILSVDATLAAWVNSAAAQLAELFDARHGGSRILITPADGGDVTMTPVDAEGAPVGEPSTVTPAEGSLAADMMADLTDHGWNESVAAAAVRTVTSPDPYADAADDEHCRHGYPYPDCAVCHRTAGGAPNRAPGEHEPCNVKAKTTPRGFDYEDHTECDSGSPCQRGTVGAANVVQIDPEMERLRAEVERLRDLEAMFRTQLSVAVGDAHDDHTKRQAAEIERLSTELAQAHRELGEQAALADAMQAGIDQCPNTHNIDWTGDE